METVNLSDTKYQVDQCFRLGKDTFFRVSGIRRFQPYFQDKPAYHYVIEKFVAAAGGLFIGYESASAHPPETFDNLPLEQIPAEEFEGIRNRITQFIGSKSYAV